MSLQTRSATRRPRHRSTPPGGASGSRLNNLLRNIDEPNPAETRTQTWPNSSLPHDHQTPRGPGSQGVTVRGSRCAQKGRSTSAHTTRHGPPAASRTVSRRQSGSPVAVSGRGFPAGRSAKTEPAGAWLVVRLFCEGRSAAGGPACRARPRLGTCVTGSRDASVVSWVCAFTCFRWSSLRFPFTTGILGLPRRAPPVVLSPRSQSSLRLPLRHRYPHVAMASSQDMREAPGERKRAFCEAKVGR